MLWLEWVGPFRPEPTIHSLSNNRHTHAHTYLRNTAEHLGKNMPFMTPKVKVRMSLVPGFNLDTHSVQWSSSIWVWLCPLAIRGEFAPYWAFTQNQPALLGSTVLCSLQVAAEIVEREAETFHVALKIPSHPRRQKLLHLGSCYGAPSAASWFFKAQLRWHLSCQDTLPLRQVLQFFFLVVMVDLHFSPFPGSSWNTSDLHFQDIQRSQRPDLIHRQEDTSWSTPGSSSISMF